MRVTAIYEKKKKNDFSIDCTCADNYHFNVNRMRIETFIKTFKKQFPDIVLKASREHIDIMYIVIHWYIQESVKG